MFIRTKNQVLILENIKQAKQYLKRSKVYEDDFYQNAFKHIVDSLKKFPNLVDTFTRMIFPEIDGENVGDDYRVHPHLINIRLEEFDRLISWVKDNKQIVNQLPKNLTQYDDLENLADDITQLNLKRKVDKFIKGLYRSMRNEVEKLNDYSRQKFDDLALQFMELPNETRKQFTPLKYFEKNNISIEEFMNILNKFINGQDVNEHEKKVRDYVKEHDLKVTYDQNNVLVIQTNDREHICELGSQKWCLVYAPDSYYGTYVGDTLNTQYIIYNFNLPPSNKNSMFGITIKPDGDIVSMGTSQNKSNRYVKLEEIKDMTGIPDSSIYSIHKEEYDNIKSNIDKLDIKKDLYDGLTIENFEEWINNYESIGFEKLDIRSFGFNFDYSKIIELMYSSFNNYKDLFKFFENRKGIFLTLVKNHDYKVKNYVGRYEKLPLNEIMEIGEEYLKSFLDTDISKRFVWYFLSYGILTEDILFLAHRLEADWELSTYTFITNSISKYGWEKVSELIIFDNIRWFESFLNLNLLKVELKNYLNSSFGITTEIDIELYKKLMDELKIFKNNEFDSFISLYLSDENKLELLKEGYVSVFKFLKDEDWKKYFKYLRTLTISERIRIIDKNAKNNNKFQDEFERIVIKIDQNFINEIIDEMVKEDSDVKITEALIDYPYLFHVFKNYLDTDNIITKLGKGNLYKLLYLDGVKVSLTNLPSGDLDKYLDIHFKSEEVLNVYNNLDQLVNRVKSSLDKVDQFDDVVLDLFKRRDFDEVLTNFYKKFLKEYTEKYLTTMNELVEKEKRDYNWRVIKPAVYEDKFNTFDEYWEEYNSLIHIYEPDEELKYDLFFDKIDEQIKYWMSKKEDLYNGVKNTMFKETSLKDVIVKYGSEYKSNPEDLVDEDYYDVENFTTDYLEFIGSMFNNENIENSNNSIVEYTKYLAGVNNNYYEEIGLKLDPKSKQWYTVITFDELAELYDISGYSSNPLNTENLWDIFENGWNDWYPDLSELVDYMNIENLYKLSNYLKTQGFDFLDTSIFDKLKSYLKKSYSDYYYFDCDYKKTNELRREHKKLRELYSDIDSILEENLEDNDDYEEAYDSIDLDEIKSAFNYSWSETDNNARANSWWESSISNSSELLEEWKDGDEKGLHDLLRWDKSDKIKVIPNIDLLDEDLFQTLSEYTRLSEYTAWHILISYVDMEGKLSLSNDDGYYSWNNDNYDYFNDYLGERLHDASVEYDKIKTDINEMNKNIIKFENFEVDRQFVGEFSSEEDAKEDLEYYKKTIENLQKNGGQVYRLVFLEDISDLDTDNLGEHWTIEVDQLSNFYNSLNSGMGEEKLPYLITADIKPNSIDEDNSFKSYKGLPHELEVNLKGEPESFSVSHYKDHVNAIRVWDNLLGS